MEAFFSCLNEIVFYSICYAFAALFYGYVIYNVGKVIIKLTATGLRKIREDWSSWRSGKDHQ